MIEETKNYEQGYEDGYADGLDACRIERVGYGKKRWEGISAEKRSKIMKQVRQAGINKKNKR